MLIFGIEIAFRIDFRLPFLDLSMKEMIVVNSIWTEGKVVDIEEACNIRKDAKAIWKYWHGGRSFSLHFVMASLGKLGNLVRVLTEVTRIFEILLKTEDLCVNNPVTPKAQAVTEPHNNLFRHSTHLMQVGWSTCCVLFSKLLHTL